MRFGPEDLYPDVTALGFSTGSPPPFCQFQRINRSQPFFYFLSSSLETLSLAFKSLFTFSWGSLPGWVCGRLLYTSSTLVTLSRRRGAAGQTWMCATIYRWMKYTSKVQSPSQSSGAVRNLGTLTVVLPGCVSSRKAHGLEEQRWFLSLTDHKAQSHLW